MSDTEAVPQEEIVKQSLSAVLEGLLFAMGQETTLKRLVKITGEKEEAVEEGLKELADYYGVNGRGLDVLRQNDKVQLVTSASVAEMVAKYQKEEMEGPLSKAAMETLSIIAYQGPITKPEIDTIRGVNSGIMLRTLLVRGIIDRKKSERDARTFSYELSMDFLRHLGVTSVREIPGYADFSENKILEKLAESVQQVEPSTKESVAEEDEETDTEVAEAVTQEGVTEIAPKATQEDTTKTEATE